MTRAAAFGYPVDDVVVEQLVRSRAVGRPTGLERGTPFSLAHRFFQTGPFRPRNVDARVPGLVLAGMGTVPGVGVPMVLLSGRLAAERVDQLRDRGGPGICPGIPAVTTLEQSYARCRELNKAYGTTYYGATFVLPRVKRHHVHALYGFCRYADDIVDDLGPAAARGAGARPGRLRRPLLRRPRLGASPTTRCSRPSSTPSAPSARRGLLRRFLRSMTMDLSVTGVRDVRRPARLHGRLGRRDRRDDAADPRASLSGGRDARTRPRHRVPAHQLPARRRRRPRPRARLHPAGGSAEVRRRPATSRGDT